MPIAGRIAWAQGLAKKLREPFEEFIKLKFVFFQPKDTGETPAGSKERQRQRGREGEGLTHAQTVIETEER